MIQVSKSGMHVKLSLSFGGVVLNKLRVGGPCGVFVRTADKNHSSIIETLER